MPQTTSSIHQQTYTFDTTLDTFQAAFLASQEPLYAQLEALKSTKKHDEERRNATLPTSLVEFDAITSKSHQIAIARFLDTGRIQALPPELQTSSAISALGAAYDSDVRHLYTDTHSKLTSIAGLIQNTRQGTLGLHSEQRSS